MKRKKKRKQKSFISTHPIILFIAIMMSSFLLLWLTSNPDLQPMRDTLIYWIVFKSALSGVVLYFTWFMKKQPLIFEKVLLTVYALMPWTALFIRSQRIILLIQSLLFVIFISCLLVHYLTDKIINWVTCVVTAFLFLTIISYIFEYTFLYNSGGIHFWRIGLAISILLTIIFIVFGKIKLKETSTSIKVICSISLFIMSFTCICFMVSNFNYAFDTSKPVEYSTIITRKRVKREYKKPTRYILVAKVENVKKEFFVDQSEYYHKDVGDTFKVLLYSGAFGDKYFISE